MRSLGVIGAGVLVTVAGVAGGAAAVSPLAQFGPYARAIACGAALLIAAVALAAAFRGQSSPAGASDSGSASASGPATSATSASSVSSAAALAAALTPARNAARTHTHRTPASLTPTAVQALAESGQPLAVIAREMRLPVDAVSMLLSLAGLPRQLQPPTA